MQDPVLAVCRCAEGGRRAKNDRRRPAMDFEVGQGLVFRQVPDHRMLFREPQGGLEVRLLQEVPHLPQVVIPVAQGPLRGLLQLLRRMVMPKA